MRRKLLLISFIFGIAFSSIAQDIKPSDQQLTDTIRMEKKGGYKFYQGQQLLKIKDLKSILKTDELAYREFKSANSSSTIGSIFSYAGGFLIGWSVGTAISGREKANWTPAAIGAGLVGISIPFAIKANKKVKKAVETFNRSCTDRKNASLFEIKLNGTGVGFAMKIY